MPSGQDTHKGLAVPLHGESEIRGESSNDMLTLTQSTEDGGDFLVFRQNTSAVPALSTIAGTEVFSVSSGGDVAMAGGITEQRKNVVAATTGADFSLVSSDSGKEYFIGESGTSMAAILPANPAAGVFFKFFVSSQDAAGDFLITSTVDSSAKIYLPGLTSAVSSGDSIQPLTTLGWHSLVLTALSSIVWFAEAPLGLSSAHTTDQGLADFGNVWGVASTVA